MNVVHEGPRALVVDDNPALRLVHARALNFGGFRVEAASDGLEAVRLFEAGAFDVILTDIDMPGMNGVELIRAVRDYDLDVPVIIITGSPSVETAIAAVEYGALRYLTKPVELKELLKVANDAVRLHRLAKAKRLAFELSNAPGRFVGDRSALTSAFEKATATTSMAYQPIVSWNERKLFGYEALLRSEDADLPNPGSVFDAAERLGRLREVGRMCRAMVADQLNEIPKNALLFLNLHPTDLLDQELYAMTSVFAGSEERIILEITERIPLDGIRDVRRKVSDLRAKGYRIALDDLGAGFAGLTSFALLEPDVAKLDMALVRNIDTEPMRQTLVRTMIAMCRELGVIVVAEGVETIEERDELARAGCDLMQGFLFGMPARELLPPSF